MNKKFKAPLSTPVMMDYLKKLRGINYKELKEGEIGLKDFLYVNQTLDGDTNGYIYETYQKLSRRLINGAEFHEFLASRFLDN